MPKYIFENLQMKFDEKTCPYNVIINTSESQNQFGTVTIEIYGQEFVKIFVTGLNIYKRSTEPSEEDIIERGRPVGYKFVTQTNVQNMGNDKYELTISGDISDILEALKNTKTIEKETYDKIYAECMKQEKNESSASLLHSSMVLFAPQVNQIQQSNVITLDDDVISDDEISDDVISQLQQNPKLWERIIKRPVVVFNTVANKVEAKYNSRTQTTSKIIEVS